ncbi:MAG: hypothetical protein ABSG87_01125 [Verrucomicrobiota bacterium]|jgi:hypothetical protein
MNRPEEGDTLDALLRDQNQYIEDNGFTARVISALPQPCSRFWLRPFLLLGTTTIGSGLAILWLPWKNLPALDLESLHSLNSQMLLPWVLVFSVLASLIWGIIAAVQLED